MTVNVVVLAVAKLSIDPHISAMTAASHPEPRRHHYVPKLLLKGFAVERKPGKFQTRVLDKQRERQFSAPIADVMVEGDFNSIQIEAERVSLETLVGRVEDAAAPVIARIVKEGSLADLTAQDRTVIAQFLALQYVRGTGHRAAFQDVGQKLGDRLTGMGLPNEESFHVGKDEAKAHGLLAIVRMAPEFAAYMAAKDLLLFRAPPENEFLIGDNPVALTNDEPAGFYGNLGLLCRGIQIYLPISSEFTLGLWCPSIREKLRTEAARGQKLISQASAFAVLGSRPLKLPKDQHKAASDAVQRLVALEAAFASGAAQHTTLDNVVRLNSLQVMHAERFLASKSGDFGLAFRMLKDSERYRQGRRMRVS